MMGNDLEDLLLFLLILAVVGLTCSTIVGFLISYYFFKTVLAGILGAALAASLFLYIGARQLHG